MAKYEYRDLKELKLLEKNPRKISKEQMDILVKSIQDNQDYFEARPIILSDRTGELVIIAGNQRYKAAKKIGLKQVPTFVLSGLTEEKEKEIIIRDNVSNGDWDMESLVTDAYWNTCPFDDWGLEIEWSEDDKDRKQKVTEMLSGLEYNPVFYEPKEIPSLTLSDCVDLSKFEAKLSALKEYDLTEAERNVLTLFAYRFIKIDFESVANFYSYNASEEMKKAIERLRLVLVDAENVGGMIDDDLLKISNIAMEEGV